MFDLKVPMLGNVFMYFTGHIFDIKMFKLGIVFY